ncbi:MAG: class I SAM-dependent methyltransferase [Candidatus Anammoxibacter sp.]
MDSAKSMYNHFSQVASAYRDVWTTDVEPIAFIRDALGKLSKVTAADVGCGTGRYDLLLFKYINNLDLTCVDINESMLEQVSDYLRRNGYGNVRTIKANADDIPLDKNSMDCILTFNAVHHFDFVKFVEKCGRAIKADGKIFIYTRLRSQNAMSIWGQHFPEFSERETRLYELDEMEQWVESIDSLELEIIKSFKYKRNTSLEHLVKQAKTKHYSTFSLYDEGDLEGAIKTFQENVKSEFKDTNEIEWFDGNILLVLKSV